MRTDEGNDYIASALFETGSAPADRLQYIVLSDDTDAPTAADTMPLAGEFHRGPATVAHTSGSDETTFTYTYTATEPVTIAKVALTTSDTEGEGVLVYVSLLSPARSLIVDDATTITITVSPPA